MIQLSEKIGSELPLDISFCSWDDTTLVISGKNWNFSTQSAWRLCKKKSIYIGCLDINAVEICAILQGKSLIEVKLQGEDKPIDLALCLSNEFILEIFSTHITEPWIIDLPTLGIFVGNT